jgi:ABC-2 type transport system ATP-binding protein
MPAPDRPATPTSDIAVELRGVVKTYRQRQASSTLRGAVRSMVRPVAREVHALRGIDLTVGRGEIVAYAGPNGAGKSTTIKLLCGILGPDAGSVSVFGRDPLAERRHHVADIGVVFGQRTELWHDHPVAATFDWKRVVWDVPDDRYRRMLGSLTDLLDLGELMPALARELSLGQRMRAELALALLHEPKLLLLDEPTIGLDVLGKRRVLAFVKELRAFRDVTVLVTSHDMADLEQLAERIVMVDRGSVAFDGDFPTLRRAVTSRRRLLLETSSPDAPALPHAELVESATGRHTYLYDPSVVDVTSLLAAAAAVTDVLETHRPDIDDVVADLYEHWRAS